MLLSRKLGSHDGLRAALLQAFQPDTIPQRSASNRCLSVFFNLIVEGTDQVEKDGKTEALPDL
jgi:hypothetical protein